MVQDLQEAIRMIDTFASVGATHFDLTHTSVDGERRGFRPTQSTGQIKNSLPKLFPGAAERHNNIIVRPLSEKVHFVQLDDLDADALKRVGELSFLTLTSLSTPLSKMIPSFLHIPSRRSSRNLSLSLFDSL